MSDKIDVLLGKAQTYRRAIISLPILAFVVPIISTPIMVFAIFVYETGGYQKAPTELLMVLMFAVIPGLLLSIVVILIIKLLKIKKVAGVYYWQKTRIEAP